ncbi:MAG: hypothetical protein K9M07_05135 [Simkaniaceae bacterium]|nr:hypothetical protein [Simkaniaceae bacterium]
MLYPNIGTSGFHEFAYNRYFVETGTFWGHGIDKALQAKFKFVRSIDNDSRLIKSCKSRFQKSSRIKLYQGDSSKLLSAMIKDIHEPITFWLDAHRYPPIDDGQLNSPILAELEQISRHPIKYYTILIDDLHCCGTAAFDYLTEKDLIEKIMQINPNYHIKHVAGGDNDEYPNNVLVAYIPKDLID